MKYLILALMVLLAGCGQKASEVCEEYGYFRISYIWGADAGLKKGCFGKEDAYGAVQSFILSDDWKRVKSKDESRPKEMFEFIPRKK